MPKRSYDTISSLQRAAQFDNLDLATQERFERLIETGQLRYVSGWMLAPTPATEPKPVNKAALNQNSPEAKKAQRACAIWAVEQALRKNAMMIELRPIVEKTGLTAPTLETLARARRVIKGGNPNAQRVAWNKYPDKLEQRLRAEIAKANKAGRPLNWPLLQRKIGDRHQIRLGGLIQWVSREIPRNQRPVISSLAGNGNAHPRNHVNRHHARL